MGRLIQQFILIGCLAIAGMGLYTGFKLVRRYQSTLPRASADGSLQVNGHKRVYNLHVPSAYTGNEPVPLVIAFHGVGGDGSTMEQAGFNSLSDRDGFIVAYPDAISKHWNTRRSDAPETADDVGFINTLIDDLENRYNLDPARIFVTGFSNGGMFAHRIGCELSDRVTAIAAVSATMPEYLSSICQPTRPISVLLIHGTADPAVPYGVSEKALLSAPATFQYWSNHNRCSPNVIKETLPNVANIQIETHDQCADGTSVKLYTIEGGGHDWLIAQAETSAPSSQGIETSEIIWDFFSQEATRP